MTTGHPADQPLGGFSSDFLETLRNLIAYFILRQQLVVLAMVELNPMAVGKSTGVDVTPYFEIERQRMLAFKKARDEGKKEAEESIWKSDWKYFTHGIGCRLTHLQTREPIEWDGPDEQAIRVDWFIHHLEWRLKNELQDPYVQLCADWISAHEADKDVIQKAVYRLIDLGIIKIQQNHSCKLAVNVESAVPLSDQVTNAVLNTLRHYRERQAYAIAAMVELRPDFIFEVAKDPYILPETAHHLTDLCQHIQEPPRSGPKIQTGRWQDVWDYEFRYATCTLSHMTTGETIRWATADPLTVDYHGYTQHFLWRLENNPDSATQVIYQWMREHRTDNFHVYTRLEQLIKQLIGEGIVALTRNEKGLLIKLNRQHTQDTN